jgi:hypothetical protein
MGFHGPEPLDTDAASFAFGKILINLQREVRDDLKAAQTDKVVERPVLAALVALRALLEAFPDYRFHCHAVDVQMWRDQYFQWLDATIGKIRMKPKDKIRLRENAAKVFDRVLEMSKSKTYPLGDR